MRAGSILRTMMRDTLRKGESKAYLEREEEGVIKDTADGNSGNVSVCWK